MSRAMAVFSRTVVAVSLILAVIVSGASAQGEDGDGLGLGGLINLLGGSTGGGGDSDCAFACPAGATAKSRPYVPCLSG